MQTYRYRGHSMSDPAKYRSKEEVQKMRDDHDPIEQVRARLLKNKQASEDDLKQIDVKVRAIVNEAGGRFTELDGAPITLASTSVLATNGRMHAPVLEALG